MKVYLCTTNAQKLLQGSVACNEHGVKLVQKKLDVDEVQSEDTEYVARRKAEASFALVKEPILVSDDSWSFAGLNGFPGTYAKSVNTWFSEDDFIRLTRDLEDRRAILTQTLVYQDEHEQIIFRKDTVGTLLKEPRGTAGITIQKVISFEPDGRSIAEVIGTGTHYSGTQTLQVWQEFAKWYKENKS